MSYRSYRAAEKDYKWYKICWRHAAHYGARGDCGYPVTCPAISLKAWLRRNHYLCSQYQGVVKTDAGLEAMYQWAHQFVSRNLQDHADRMFDRIPTSILALGHICIKDAPRQGYGLFGKSHILIDAVEVDPEITPRDPFDYEALHADGLMHCTCGRKGCEMASWPPTS